MVVGMGQCMTNITAEEEDLGDADFIPEDHLQQRELASHVGHEGFIVNCGKYDACDVFIKGSDWADMVDFDLSQWLLRKEIRTLASRGAGRAGGRAGCARGCARRRRVRRAASLLSPRTV